MKHKLTILLFTFGFLAFSELMASHVIGGEITYRSLGGKKYEFTARVYRDCRGIPFNSPDFRIFDYNGGYNKAVTYTRTSIEDISPKCADSIPKICNPANQTISAEGIELHTFKATVDFGTAPFKAFVDSLNICQIGISVEQCCRSGSITTLSPGNFYVQAMVNICYSKYKNTSPQFPSLSFLSPVCNSPYAYNFGGVDYVDYDSLLFELIAPMNGRNSYETFASPFSTQYPMTPYCPPTPGKVNCTPLPNSSPPRGFYFNPLNGDVLLYPYKCDEVAVIDVKISEFRKDSAGVWRLVGFVTRDIQVTVKSTTPKNYYHTNSIKYPAIYKFKTRENHCEEFTTYDTIVTGYSSGNRGDKITVSMLTPPPGMTLSYKDSSAKYKTARICWTPPDSVYNRLHSKAKVKHLPVTLEIRDNFCNIPYIIRKTFHTYIVPPDSTGKVLVKTYDDRNRNRVSDVSDTLMPTLLKRKYGKTTTPVQTDQKGFYKDSLWNGSYTYGVVQHPYYAFRSKDTTLIIKMDSTHSLKFITERSPGIYGRIYQDANSNCKYDAGEKTFPGYKVYTDSNKYTGISDNSGIYFIKAPKGSYKLTCENLAAKYTVACPSTKTINITIDGTSSYANNDFGVVPANNFNDLSVGIKLEYLKLNLNGDKINFYCTNNGSAIRRNIQVKCPLPKNVQLMYLSYNLFAAAGTTAVIQIDSLYPGQTFYIRLLTGVNTPYFKTKDKVTFTCMLDSVSNLAEAIKSNDTASEYRIIDGFFKPNQKNIGRDSIFSPLDKEISYSIHYLNLGSETAQRMIITDTLDKQYHDISKFRLNWTDYPCETVIADNVIIFIFDGINLPPASNRFGLGFTVGLKSNVTPEVSFKNRATVYFDQTPMLTPSVIGRIISPLSITKVLKASICRYEKNKVYYNSIVKFNTGNQLIFELSDNTGSFSSPITLKTVNTISGNDSIDFLFPKSLATGTYKIRMRSTNPVSSEMPVNGNVSFTVLPSPAFTVSTNLNNNGICEKDTLKITCIGSYFYKTLKNNISQNNFTSTSFYKYAINLNDKFKVAAQDNSTLCKDTISINPTVFMKPALTIKTRDGKTEYCKNEMFTLQGSGAKWYQFMRNDTSISTKSLSDTLPYSMSFSSKFRVIGESSDGCVNISAALSLTANALPAPFNVAASPNNVCPGDSFYFNYFGDLSYYYITLRNDTVIRAKTDKVVFKTAYNKSSDKFSVIGINSKGCTLKNNNPSITMAQPPAKPVIVRNGNTLSIDPTGTKTISWYRNGVLYNNVSTLTNAENGTYYVVITNAAGCKSRSDDFTFFKTGIQETAFLNYCEIFPNPANTILNITSDPGTKFRVELIDLSGKLVYSGAEQAGECKIGLELLSEGVYFVRIFSEDRGVQVERIVVQR